MKRFTWLVTAFMLTLGQAVAQGNMEGVVIYEVEPKRGGNAPQKLPALKKELVFRGEESLYKTSTQNDKEDYRFSGGEGGRQIYRPGAEDEIYINTGTGERKESRVVMGKRYLIESSVTEIPWKLSGDTTTILGYHCKRASYHDMKQDRDISVWYTEDIPVPSGPSGYHSLPGVILELDAGDGRMKIRALSVNLGPLEENELKPPKRGKSITAEEFEEIREAQLKRLKERRKSLQGKPVILR